VVARAAENQRLGRLSRALHPDVEYIERAAGPSTLHGRDEVRAWTRETITTFPGCHRLQASPIARCQPQPGSHQDDAESVRPGNVAMLVAAA
jgi:hypothetical protein